MAIREIRFVSAGAFRIASFDVPNDRDRPGDRNGLGSGQGSFSANAARGPILPK
jgi:hypothetical protein